jgi:uncharacterized protein YaaQ
MDLTGRTMNVNRLMAAVIQEQDVDTAVEALAGLEISATRISSVGGFLNRRNVTLLIGFNEAQQAGVLRALAESCRRRVEYIATPVEGSPLPLPSPTPVPVGGATIFVFEVERYEEL